MARLLALGALLGALLGLAWAQLSMPAHGTDHSCPAGSSVSACSYPLDRAGHLVGWAVAGLFLGLLLAAGVGRLRQWQQGRQLAGRRDSSGASRRDRLDWPGATAHRPPG